MSSRILATTVGSVRALARTLPPPAMLVQSLRGATLLECGAALTIFFDPEP